MVEFCGSGCPAADFGAYALLHSAIITNNINWRHLLVGVLV